MKKQHFIGASLAIALVSTATFAAEIGYKFVGVPAPEIAAKAASLVSKASPAEQKQTTIDAVTAAIQVKTVSAPAVVGEIARSTPESAAVAAVTAAKLQPQQLGAITKAAVSAAPKQLKEIVAALCKEFPHKVHLIANAAAGAVHGKDKEILSGVAEGLPALKSSLERAVADAEAKGSTVSVPSIIAHDPPAPVIPPSGGNVVVTRPAPIIGPPFTPGGGTPGETGSTNSQPIGPGQGRNYSAP